MLNWFKVIEFSLKVHFIDFQICFFFGKFEKSHQNISCLDHVEIDLFLSGSEGNHIALVFGEVCALEGFQILFKVIGITLKLFGAQLFDFAPNFDLVGDADGLNVFFYDFTPVHYLSFGDVLVLIEDIESHPGYQAKNAMVLEGFTDWEGPVRVTCSVVELLLLDEIWVIFVKRSVDNNRIVVIRWQKTILKQESCITFITVALVNLLPSFDIFLRFDTEAISFVIIEPPNLAFLLVLMIEHVCHGYHG